jgi:hypothetical protein
VRPSRLVILSLFFVALTLEGTANQAATKDITAVYADGKVADGQYKNAYFGLTLTPENAQFTQGGFVSSEGQRARLVDAQANAANWDDRYEIAILADALSANPLVTSPTQYVRSVRHQLEKERFETVQAESAIEISGSKFVYATMKIAEDGKTHYRGLYTTFLNGYILSLDVTVGSAARLKSILKMVKFEAPRK